MKCEEKLHRINPKLTASWLNRLFFGWLVPIFRAGNRHKLESQDLYEVLPENRSEPVTDRLEKFWSLELTDNANKEKKEKKKKKPSLLRAVRRTFFWSFVIYGIHNFFLHLVCKIVQPYLLGQLIRHFDESSDTSTNEAYGYATAFVLIIILDNTLFSHIMFGLRNVGISARVACASLLYRKIMKLPYSAKQASGGKIINLLSNDAAKLEISFLFIHTLWILPIQTIVITYLICHGIGYVAGLAGVLSLICQTIPVQSFSSRLITRFRKKIAAKTDERLLLTDEVIRGIRVIKMYTWEKPFEQLVFLARRYEIDIITTSSYLKSMLFATFAFAQRVPLFISVTIYVLQTGSISAYTIFTLLQYFNVLHVMMGSFFLRSVNILSEAIASIGRMQEFLLLDEKVSNVKFLEKNNMDDAVVSLNDVSASTIEMKDVTILHDITLDLRKKLLYAVVGPVGAGKSSLLKLILDELKPSKGQVIIYGNVSYASQEPWIFKGTVRNNILFGETYDPKKYEQVTKACSLLEDFEQLPNGDQSIIGESVTNLSGGQCARINLARAVYKDADIYLLDDPFSAVDSRVGKILFEECINGLLVNKTRVIVTHQGRHLKDADGVILINSGRIEFQGGFDKLEKNNDFFEYLSLNDLNEADLTNKKEISKSSAKIEKIANEENDPKETEKLLISKQPVKKIDEKLEVKPTKQKSKPQYWKYFTASGSYVYPLATLFAFIGSQLICCGCDYFVAYWTRKQNQPVIYTSVYNSTNLHNVTDIQKLKETGSVDSNTAIYIFGSLIAAIIVTSITKMILFTTTCRKSNEKIHNNMVVNLLRASMRFFETNDSGRILNRFSKDLGTVDERLQGMMLEALEFIFTIFGIILQIVIVNRWSMFLIVFMGFLYWKSREMVIKTTRNIMRLEGQAKSPVFAYVNSSLSGIITIRSRHAQAIACKEFDAHQDNHTVAAAISQYAFIAYNYWLDWITLLLTIFLTFSFILFKDERTAGADVGLAMTQVIILCGVLARGIKLSGEIETQMVSVERLLEYTNLEKEDLMDNEIEQKPPSSWPSHGKIVFDNLSLRYLKDDVAVLKDLEFTIEACTKVGIVGRTGAGKSSLITALFRLAEIEGSIYIDDVDTKTVLLKHLRNKISILPQEPILFSLSLRKNLDPLNEFDDVKLWSALRDVELNKVFDNLDRTLEQSNLSAGQKQLLCLARTILRRNKILILDEATANVDPNTTILIQKTISSKFEDCTILMIAHRLSTVMDCDMILVIDQGQVVEYDSPSELMKRNDSYFSRMISQYRSAPIESMDKISDEIPAEE